MLRPGKFLDRSKKADEALAGGKNFSKDRPFVSKTVHLSLYKKKNKEIRKRKRKRKREKKKKKKEKKKRKRKEKEKETERHSNKKKQGTRRSIKNLKKKTKR